MSAATNPKNPNILIIMTDEQRYDAAGFLGNSQLKTPHLDSIAGDGVNFTHSFCPFAVCTPSRYSMLTGLYVHQHRGRTNKSTPSGLLDTYPRILQRNGYTTRCVGKMHFYPTYLDVGFETMDLAEQHGDGRLEDEYHRDLKEAGLVDYIDLFDQRPEFRERAPKEYWDNFGALVSNLPEEYHSTSWIGEKSVKRLEDWDDSGGNLLVSSFIKPHHPFDPPPRWADMYDPGEIDILPGWTDEVLERDQKFNPGFFSNEDLTRDAMKRITAFYYATISHIDHQIGRMIETLKKKNLYDDTLIVFTSDHGEFLGFHHMILKNNYYYDPIVRVPLLIKWPGNTDAGTARDTLTNNVDLAPTLLRAANVEPPPQMIGLDLADPGADREYVFSEAGHGMMYMARSRKRKLCMTREEDMRLFVDLEKDPLEMENVIHDPAYAEEVARHREAISEWLLFDALVPVCVNEEAPCVRGLCPTCVPGSCTIEQCRATLHNEMLSYFEQKAEAMLQ